MEEVEFLCNRVGIIDHGEVIALGTQSELCSRLVGGSIIQLNVENDTIEALNAIRELENVKKVVTKEDSNIIEIFAEQPYETLGSIMTAAINDGMKVGAVEIKEPNLETLFLQLTGRSLRD